MGGRIVVRVGRKAPLLSPFQDRQGTIRQTFTQNPGDQRHGLLTLYQEDGDSFKPEILSNKKEQYRKIDADRLGQNETQPAVNRFLGKRLIPYKCAERSHTWFYRKNDAKLKKARFHSVNGVF